MSSVRKLLIDALKDHRNEWSMGTFGAVGEFVWSTGERLRWHRSVQRYELESDRGAIRIANLNGIRVIAYDLLNSDGETWTQAVAFCLPNSVEKPMQCIRIIGPDIDAIRVECNGDTLVDLGVGRGFTRMCIRTDNSELLNALRTHEGHSLLSNDCGWLRELLLAVSPHRVMQSPAGRLEVYTAIPAPGGKSPLGPHTHLLPKLLAGGRTHSSNEPIPCDLQPALMMYPRSPCLTECGERTAFNADLDQRFNVLWEKYALPEDQRIRSMIEHAVQSGLSPFDFAWPISRRERIQARITLRRLAQRTETDALRNWRRAYDHL